MYTKTEILQIAKEQLALDYNCQVSDFEKWSKETTKYNLGEEFALERVEYTEFSKYHSVYHGLQKANGWFKKSFDMMRSVVCKDDDYFWIIKDCVKVGGIFIQPNHIGELFVIPPYSDEYKLLKKVKEILVYWSDRNKNIEVSVVELSQIDIYEKIGFIKGESGRWMIRPTEEFKVTWERDFNIVIPKEENKLEMAELIFQAFQNDVGLNSTYSVEERVSWIEDYFKDNSQIEVLNKASTLIYNKKTKELVGVCLISLWQEWPLVWEIAVNPSYAGKGLGTKMLKKALSVLQEEYPVLRLYVTVGNKAENVYHNLGFLKGLELVDMKLIPDN
ncbi:MAG: GNAT family N-acetyltransferase [Clostridium sp.]|uniref:GNAT family N-acetyltransferase n=1 Tax=Clostridium sp. TaxID=1506 RepID=UPI003D6D599A